MMSDERLVIQTTELLAPARDLACGRAAIDAGADAVYIGAPRFGARSRAGNDLDDISALVAYAHFYWARVYVTVNTLLYDDELADATAMIHDLHAIGVDAIIVQDAGLLECDLPPIPLIASTQMHNTTPERVRFLERIGFRRAILARELTLDEIRAIRKATKRIELEVFVHGALCVSYSGQCTMSYAVGGRSGNRGECAQPCRRSYSLIDAQGHILDRDHHLLSLRDMNRLTDLGMLLDAGVTSFKIEGRLKDAGYVTNVVSAYRQALDGLLPSRGLGRSSSGISRWAVSPDIDKTFNRGFTPYFLHGRERSPGAIDTPKMVGEFIGVVATVDSRHFTMSTDVELHNGDGLAFFGEDGTLAGTVVNGARRKNRTLLVIPNTMHAIRAGARIYRNHDHDFLRRIEETRPERTIGVHFALQEAGGGLALRVEDEDGIDATARLSGEQAVARKPEQAEETARTQLAKTGGTPYRCTSIALAWSRPYFLTFSALNELRREVLERLTAAREAHRPVMSGTVEANDATYPEQALTFRGNVLNEKAASFYRRHGVMTIEPAAESGLDMRGRVVMTTRYCIKEELGWCPRTGAAPEHPEPLYLIDDRGHSYELRFRCSPDEDACGMDVVY